MRCHARPRLTRVDLERLWLVGRGRCLYNIRSLGANLTGSVSSHDMSRPRLRPSVSDLVYRLYNRALHPELFEVRATQCLAWPHATLWVGLTATGHVLTWSDSVQMLTEVTAVADQTLPTRGLLAEHRLLGERTVRVSLRRSLRVEVVTQVEVLPADIFANEQESFLLHGQRRGLLHNFQPDTTPCQSPLGCAVVHSRIGCLVVTTFHTFPDERAILKTQTLIEQPRADELTADELSAD